MNLSFPLILFRRKEREGNEFYQRVPPPGQRETSFLRPFSLKKGGFEGRYWDLVTLPSLSGDVGCIRSHIGLSSAFFFPPEVFFPSPRHLGPARRTFLKALAESRTDKAFPPFLCSSFPPLNEGPDFHPPGPPPPLSPLSPLPSLPCIEP